MVVRDHTPLVIDRFTALLLLMDMGFLNGVFAVTILVSMDSASLYTPTRCLAAHLWLRGCLRRVQGSGGIANPSDPRGVGRQVLAFAVRLDFPLVTRHTSLPQPKPP